MNYKRKKERKKERKEERKKEGRKKRKRATEWKEYFSRHENGDENQHLNLGLSQKLLCFYSIAAVHTVQN